MYIYLIVTIDLETMENWLETWFIKLEDAEKYIASKDDPKQYISIIKSGEVRNLVKGAKFIGRN